MPLREDVTEQFPTLWDDFERQNEQSDIGDHQQTMALLTDWSAGIPARNRDWRKAVFRLLDVGFSAFDTEHDRGGARLDAKIFPFTTHYCSSLLSKASRSKVDANVSDVHSANDLTNMLSRSVGLFQSRSTCLNFASYFLSSSELLSIAERTGRAKSEHLNTWTKFIQCLRTAENYDLCRIVFSFLSSEAQNEISEQPKEVIGHVMSLWQYVLDKGDGNCNDLRRILFSIVKTTSTLPESLVIKGIRLDNQRVLIHGGCADIHRGILSSHRVALKVLRIPPNYGVERAFQEVCSEAIVWRQLNHPNVTPFIGVCNDLFAPFFALVSPWMEFGDLSQFLRENPDEDRLAIVGQIASGMSYLHSRDPQVIHGDFRACNVLVDNQRVPRITDFGLSRVNVIQTKLTVQVSKGAVRWQAPELLYDKLGTSHITTESDVYAFGMTCLEVFTGEIPFSDVKNDGAVICDILVNRKTPNRPLATVVVERGLNDRVWDLMMHCWKSPAHERPAISHVDKDLLRENERKSGAKDKTRELSLPTTLIQPEDALKVPQHLGEVRGSKGSITSVAKAVRPHGKAASPPEDLSMDSSVDTGANGPRNSISHHHLHRMNGSSSTSVAKTPAPLPQKSAWAKGPPPNTSAASSPRSQSPAPGAQTHATPTHSRRSSQLSGFKDGVGVGIGVSANANGPRGSVVASKPGNPINFGTVNDKSGAVSSPPSEVPSVVTKSEPRPVQSFGTIEATPSTSSLNGKTASTVSSTASSTVSASTSSTAHTTPATMPIKPKPKLDVSALFRGSSSTSGAPLPVTSSSLGPPSHQQHQPHHPQHQHQRHQPHQHQQHQQHQPQMQPGMQPMQPMRGWESYYPYMSSVPDVRPGSGHYMGPYSPQPLMPPAGMAPSGSGGGAGGTRLNTNAGVFVPSQGARIKITDASGHGVDFGGLTWKTGSAAPSPGDTGTSPSPSSMERQQQRHRRAAVRLESEETRQKRIAEEEKVRKAKEGEERGKREIEEQRVKERQEEQKKREEEERIQKKKEQKLLPAQLESGEAQQGRVKTTDVPKNDVNPGGAARKTSPAALTPAGAGTSLSSPSMDRQRQQRRRIAVRLENEDEWQKWVMEEEKEERKKSGRKSGGRKRYGKSRLK